MNGCPGYERGQNINVYVLKLLLLVGIFKKQLACNIFFQYPGLN
jgi:hypothetical protein